MEKIQIDYQKDELKKGRYKVVILHNKQIIGTPARDKTRIEAVVIARACHHAFEYGFLFGCELSQKALHNVNCEVTSEPLGPLE